MLEIDLQAEPPGLKDIEAERAELENSRLLVTQNELYVANLYRKLMLKIAILILLLVIVALLYFILPPGIFGIVNGRTIFLVVLSVMLVASIFWIGSKTVLEAKSVIPSRGYSREQLRLLEVRMHELADIDPKRRLNVVNWSRMDGVLAEYMKKVVRLRRHLIGLEYEVIRLYMKAASRGKDSE